MSVLLKYFIPVSDTGGEGLAAEFTFIYHGFLEATTAFPIDNTC